MAFVNYLKIHVPEFLPLFLRKGLAYLSAGLKEAQPGINAGEGVEKREPSYTVGGNALICTTSMENSVEIP